MSGRLSLAAALLVVAIVALLFFGAQHGQLLTAAAFVVVVVAAALAQAKQEALQYQQDSKAERFDAELTHNKYCSNALHVELARRTQLALHLASLNAYLEERRQAREAQHDR